MNEETHQRRSPKAKNGEPDARGEDPKQAKDGTDDIKVTPEEERPQSQKIVVDGTDG